jgi:hypothetical protein
MMRPWHGSHKNYLFVEAPFFHIFPHIHANIVDYLIKMVVHELDDSQTDLVVRIEYTLNKHIYKETVNTG